MTSAIVAAIIGSCTSIIVSLISAHVERKKLVVEQVLKDDRIDRRLAVLEKKIELHNQYAELFHEIKKDIALIHKDIEFLKNKV